MRPQAHVASGLLVWSLGDAPLRQAPIDALAANLPDLDRNVARWLGVRRRDHHRWVSHSAAGWAIPTLLARGRPRARRVVALAWLHLLLDTYADGIAWLWPVHQEKLGLFRKPAEIRDDGWSTPVPLSSEPGKVELALWLLSAASAARRLAGSGAGRARSSRRRPRRRVRRRAAP